MEKSVRFAGLSLTIAVVVTVCSMGLADQVGAIDIVLDENSSQFLGIISPDGGSPEAEATQITHLVSLAPGSTDTFGGDDYERSLNSCGTCPDATAVGSVANETGNNTGDFGSGFTYLKGKYDAAQAGALVWYVAGLTGTFEIPQEFGTCGATGCGLSHWLLLNPGGNNVAEPSTTLLAGLAFAGIAFFSRKFLPKA
jgi:hypothetical protein